jgi:hypothetical protein
LAKSYDAHGAGITAVLDVVRQIDLAEQLATLDRSALQGVGTEAGELVDVEANLLVVGAREGRAWKGHRTTEGTHAKVDTTLNVYTQVVDGSLRRAADAVGSELFTDRNNRRS